MMMALAAVIQHLILDLVTGHRMLAAQHSQGLWYV